MPGFGNDIMYANNVDFSGAHPVTKTVTADGQLLIGSTATPNIKVGSLTSSDSSVTITVGSGTIDLTVTGGSGAVVWTDQGVSFNAAAKNGYFCTAAITATLPASPSEGDTIMFVATSTSVLTIQANTGQVIQLGTSASASAGTATSNAAGDSIILTYRSTGTTWWGRGPTGTWTIT